LVATASARDGLTYLLKAHPDNEVDSRSPGDGKPKVSVVRSKPRK